VLRETDPQPSLWEALLPEEAKWLPAELARIDAYLDDERFVAPWRTLFDRRVGASVGPGRHAAATAVLEAPLWAGLQEPVPGCQRLEPNRRSSPAHAAASSSAFFDAMKERGLRSP
jgi:hypothetical protein